jgi:hypothetical protein
MLVASAIVEGIVKEIDCLLSVLLNTLDIILKGSAINLVVPDE